MIKVFTLDNKKYDYRLNAPGEDGLYVLSGKSYEKVEEISENLQLEIDKVLSDYAMELLRIERDRLLQECDWRDLPSYPGTDQEEWRTYRQALRDLPNNSEPQLNDAGELINIVWPEKPNGGV